jgi:hypothetical protein
MPYNLLLLPLLGGFLFVRYWNPTRYHALRSEKERLLILAALAGLASLIIAFAIVTALGILIPCRAELPCFAKWWADHVPFDYSGTSLLAFTLGATCWYPLNWRYKQQEAIDKVIDEDKAPFELLLKKAQDQAKTVAVTMKSGKVYVGFVIHAFHPALPTRFIQLLPTKSGYRDDKNKWFQFTTFYSEALDKVGKDYDSKWEQLEDLYAQLHSEREKDREKQSKQLVGHLNELIKVLGEELSMLEAVADDFGIVLPVPEIVSINIYSEYIHSEYFPPKSEG